MPMGEKESLGSCLSSLMVAFLDAASTRMFSEALYVISEIVQLGDAPFTAGNTERKHSHAALHGLPVF